jgi:hypothetical protein
MRLIILPLEDARPPLERPALHLCRRVNVPVGRGLTQHLIDEKYIKEPTPEMLEEALEKAIAQVD